MQLPPVKSFQAAIAYMATHAVEFLRATWLPTALLTAVGIYALPRILVPMLEVMALGPEPDPNRLMEVIGPAGRPLGILFLASLVLYPMVYVAGMRHILLGQNLRLPFYFQFGGAEFRVLATFTLLIVMLSLIEMIAGLGIDGLALAGRAAGPDTAKLVENLLTFAYTVFALWLQLRFSLALPAAIADRRIGLPLSWYKTKGNSLRLLLFYILFALIFLPIVGLVGIFNWSPTFALIEATREAGNNPVMQVAAMKDFLQPYIDRLSPSHPGFALSVIFYFFYNLISVVIGTIPTAIAYRYIVGEARQA